jgi:hypothetical protein
MVALCIAASVFMAMCSALDQHFALAWVAIYPNGARRMRPSAGRDQDCILRAAPWLQGKLAQLNLEKALDIPAHPSEASSCAIVGLIAVQQGHRRSTLGPRSAETELQWQYFLRPCDAFTVKVQHAFRCAPAAVPFMLRRSEAKNHKARATAEPKRVTVGHKAFVWNIDALSTQCLVDKFGVARQARDVFLRLGLDDTHLASVPTLLVVAPIGHLLVSGHLSELMCLARWRQPWWQDWPPQSWVSNVMAQQAAKQSPASVSATPRAAQLQTLVADLRRWAPRILGAALADVLLFKLKCGIHEIEHMACDAFSSNILSSFCLLYKQTQTDR